MINILDYSSFYKEKIVCTYDDIIQLPDYIILKLIKSRREYFKFYIDIDKLDKYNDDTLMRLAITRTEKDIFKCLKKPSIEYKPELRSGIYKIIGGIYEDAPILNTVNMINTIGTSTDFVYNFTMILNDQRQLKRINELISRDIKYNTIYSYEPSVQKFIHDSTIIITDDINLIINSFNRDPSKKYLVPITGYLCNKIDGEYIFHEHILKNINDYGLISAVTFYQSFNFEKKHLD